MVDLFAEGPDVGTPIYVLHRSKAVGGELTGPIFRWKNGRNVAKYRQKRPEIFGKGQQVILRSMQSSVVSGGFKAVSPVATAQSSVVDSQRLVINKGRTNEPVSRTWMDVVIRAARFNSGEGAQPRRLGWSMSEKLTRDIPFPFSAICRMPREWRVAGLSLNYVPP